MKLIRNIESWFMQLGLKGKFAVASGAPLLLLIVLIFFSIISIESFVKTVNVVKEVSEIEKLIGDLETGEAIMAFKQDQALNSRDKITYGGQTFMIKRIEEFPFAGGNLVKIAIMAELVV